MENIILTDEEQVALTADLHKTLDIISKHHLACTPSKEDTLKVLMEKYFYWGDTYNDGYIPEMSMSGKQFAYLVQEFKKYMA